MCVRCVLQKEEETARQKAMTQIADAHMVMDKIKQADQKDEKLLSWVNQVADLAVWSCHDCICRACGFHHGLLATQPMVAAVVGIGHSLMLVCLLQDSGSAGK